VPCRRPRPVRPGCRPRNSPPNNPAAPPRPFPDAAVRNTPSAAKP